MSGRLFADQGQGRSLIVGDGAPGPGFLYYDDIGIPRCLPVAVFDIGDILDE